MSSPSFRPHRRRRKAEINIVPLVDVLVVLIFFFLVSMQFRNLTTLQLNLPEIETAGESEREQQVHVAITEEGDLYFNNEPVSPEELSEQLALVARTNPRAPVLIMADEASFLRYTTLVMDLARQHGLETLRIQSR